MSEARLLGTETEPPEIRLIRSKVKARREALDKWLADHPKGTRGSWDDWGLSQLETLLAYIDAHEAALKERGWQDEYEVETAAAMNHGNGAYEARQQGREREAGLRKLLELRPSGHTGPLDDRIPWFIHCGISHGADRPDCVVCRALAADSRPEQPAPLEGRLRIRWHPGEQPPFVAGRTYRCVSVDGHSSGVEDVPADWTVDFDYWDAP